MADQDMKVKPRRKLLKGKSLNHKQYEHDRWIVGNDEIKFRLAQVRVIVKGLPAETFKEATQGFRIVLYM